ncbi:MAG: glycosyltransferase [Planctomycetota bacterium]|nr:glycosyltransferase [Planctomycetota bacterium]
MKIVYLSGSDIPSRSANSIQVMRMCEAFAGAGHETTLIGRRFKGGRQDDPYEFYGVRRNFELDLVACRRIRGQSLLGLPALGARLRRYDPEQVLIYARDVYGLWLAVRMGFRAVYEAHAAPYNVLIGHLETTVLKSPRLLRLVVISEALKRMYIGRYNVAHKTVVCHDAAAVPGPADAGDLPWPPCRRTLQIGYTGHLYPGKGAEIVLACAERLCEYDFHIVGGTDADIAFWKAKATSNVLFHGFLAPGRLDRARARFDVLLLPAQRSVIVPYSRSDIAAYMSPLKLFEYMASRRPIIASDLPVLREVLNERMAMLVPPDDMDRWVEAIQKCGDRSWGNVLADHAYNTFVEHYTWDTRARKVLEGIAI